MLTVTPIREVFPALLPGLTHIRSTSPTVDWTLTSLYRDCAEGRANVLVDETRGVRGFLIYMLRSTDLVLWVVYTKHPRAQKTYLSEVVEFARFHGCTRIVMESARRGFLKDPQWKPLCVRYAMDIAQT